MQRLERYRWWFYAAAAYNVCWGSAAMLLAGSSGWKVVGLLLLVFAPAYWWAARAPDRHVHLVLVASLGKLLGPLALACGLLLGLVGPGLTLVVAGNDLIWWPAFAAYLQVAVPAEGGWRAVLSGR
jgi:hypothetical protein